MDRSFRVKFDGSREDLLKFIETKMPLSKELRNLIPIAYCLVYAIPSLLDYFNEYRNACKEETCS